MTVVDDVIAKRAEIMVKVRWMRQVSNSRVAGDNLWVAGDGAYTDYKSILDVQSNLLTTLAADLETLVT